MLLTLKKLKIVYSNVSKFNPQRLLACRPNKQVFNRIKYVLFLTNIFDYCLLISSF